jgi:hypothetical protein
MPVTKANKLPEEQYLKMLDAAKYLRGEIVKINKVKRVWRVYTEARKGGLRSKMEIGISGLKLKAIQQLANKQFPNLDIQIKLHNATWMWSNSGVCIFIKVK